MGGIADADSAEHGSASTNLLITPITCQPPRAGARELPGGNRMRVQPGSLLHSLVDAAEIEAEFWCNYGVNTAYQSPLETAGVVPVAFGAAGEWRAIELRGHPFFLATLFLPQRDSAPGRPSPVLVGFLRAVYSAANRDSCAAH